MGNTSLHCNSINIFEDQTYSIEQRYSGDHRFVAARTYKPDMFRMRSQRGEHYTQSYARFGENKIDVTGTANEEQETLLSFRVTCRKISATL